MLTDTQRKFAQERTVWLKKALDMLDRGDDGIAELTAELLVELMTMNAHLASDAKERIEQMNLPLS